MFDVYHSLFVFVYYIGLYLLDNRRKLYFQYCNWIKVSDIIKRGRKRVLSDRFRLNPTEQRRKEAQLSWSGIVCRLTKGYVSHDIRAV